MPQAPGSDRSTSSNELIVENKSTDSSDGSIDEKKDSNEKEGILKMLKKIIN